MNGLEFTQDGDLLISIGGFTNAGLPGKGLGQGWEVPLSGSIVLARITSQKNFDGTMTYSNDTHPHRGIVTGGGLAFVATGIRNAFFLSLHSSGRLYTVDNGPNVGFGNVVANCEEADLNIEYPTTKVSDWPGTVELGPPGNKYSIGRPDKLLHIRMEDGQKARFYGHANLNRKECSWIDPLSGRDGLDRPAPDSYQGPLDLLTSSVNAVVEYHVGNVFDGEMRGKLILSTFQNRKTYMMGAVNMVSDGGREIISKQGGLCAVVNGRGDIIIGRFTQNDILVLRPKVGRLEQREEMSISGVTPFRHGLGGGTMASISGYNFGVESVLVEIGGRRCRMKSQKDNLIQCEVPDGEFSGMAADVRITKSNGETAELKKAVWYMRV